MSIIDCSSQLYEPKRKRAAPFGLECMLKLLLRGQECQIGAQEKSVGVAGN